MCPLYRWGRKHDGEQLTQGPTEFNSADATPEQISISLPHGNKMRKYKQGTKITDVFLVIVLVLWIRPAASKVVKAAGTYN